MNEKAGGRSDSNTGPSPVMGRIVLATIGVLVALVTAELGFRTWAPQHTGIAPTEIFKGLTAPKAGVEGQFAIPGTFDSRIVTNEQRFRNAFPTAIEPAEGTVRIAALGDSYTWGYGVDNDETYPAQLEVLLNRRCSGSDFEVLNAGLPARGVGWSALWYARWVSRFRPELVVLTVHPNDADDVARENRFEWTEDERVRPRSESDLLSEAQRLKFRVRSILESIPGYQLLIENSHLVNFIRVRVRKLLGEIAYGKPGAEHEPSERYTNSRTKARVSLTGGGARSSGPYALTLTSAGGLAPGRQEAPKRRLEKFAAIIEWLYRKVRSDGGRLFVAYVPSLREARGELDKRTNGLGEVSAQVATTTQKIARKLRVPFVNLTGKVRRITDQSGQSLYFHGRDNHPTSKGYKVFAQGIKELLCEDVADLCSC